MNTEDDPITYFKYLSGGSSNELLQQPNYELQDTLTGVESFFIENETWSPESFQVLLNEYKTDVENTVNSEENTDDCENEPDEITNTCSTNSNDLNAWNDFYNVLKVYKCKICSFLCENSVEMCEHLNQTHEDLLKSKQNNNCKQKSNNVKMKSVLISNQNENSDDEDENLTLFICSFCNNLFATRQLLMCHLEEVHENIPENTQSEMRNLASSLIRTQQKAMKRVKCSVQSCNLKFSCNETKKLHEACHVPDKKQFRCSVCAETFPVWRNCSRHLWIQHKIDTGLYTCPMCNQFKSNSPVVVMNHMDIHGTERPFKCSECGKGFKQDTQLRNHSHVHKSTKNTPLPQWSSSARCNICERYFANSKSLKKHIECVHEKLKPFVCNICGHRTNRKAMLELHLRQHTGDKPHKCQHCVYRTADHNCLRRHLMTHYGAMKYSCPYCKYKSIQSVSFKKHLASRHPEKEGIHKCKLCTYTSVNFDNYLTHVKCHDVL